jgi:hypothetical protein
LCARKQKREVKELLEVKLMDYPKSLLDQWKRGDYSFLSSSSAPEYIKDILIVKAEKRPGRRFFGEAYIASKLGHTITEGWYNSFKWLTASKWVTGKKLEPRFGLPFYEALCNRIGANIIADLQQRAKSYYHGHGNELENKKPVAPDLWLVDANENFMFIESKMEGDQIKPHQLAGLALISKYLKALVCIICLHEEGQTPLASEIMQNYIDKFSMIYRVV